MRGGDLAVAGVTIYDVAKLSGVSTGTVSRVINNGPGVREITVKRVRDAMATLRYEAPPPGQRRGFRRPKSSPRRTHRMALLVPGMSSAMLHSPVYMDVQRGVEEAARTLGLSMLLRNIPRGSSLREPLLHDRVDGVVLFGWRLDMDLHRQLQDFPVVAVMGRTVPQLPCDLLTYDNRKIGLLAADYLLSRRHRACAFLGDPSEEGVFAERRQLFADTILRHGGSVVAGWELERGEGAGHEREVDRAFLGPVLDRLFSSDPKPTGLFISSDRITAAAYPLLYERGILPGRDVDIVSCNNEELLLANLHPRPATVDIHAEVVGYRAVEQLLWRIDHPQEPRINQLIDPELIPPRGE